ncbi:MAG TPA: glycosyltransferase [Polyangiaceae bacterium]|nr:glycosyltransferase [Polyangiaceae bacterium]
MASHATLPPLTIAHVITSLGIGGLERVVLDLVVAQRKAGHEVYVVVLNDGEGPLREAFRAAADGLVAFPKREVGVDPSLVGRLARWLRAKRVRVVHTHNNSPLTYGAPAGKLAGAAVVHSKHGEHRAIGRQMWLRRLAATATDAYVAVSPTTAAFAREHRECTETKLEVIPNGTDLSRFPAPAEAAAAARASLGLAAGARVIGTVGRMVPEKNHALLLRAAAPLLGPETKLVIVGDGPLRAGLEAQRAALPNAEHVVFAGMRRDVPDLLAALDVFVLSSATEGLPVVLLEAMASRLPVVSTAVGGIPDVVHAGTGVLVPPHDEAALREAVAGLLADPERARGLGERARATALETMSVDRMAEAYAALYRRVLGRGRRGGAGAGRSFGPDAPSTPPP